MNTRPAALGVTPNGPMTIVSTLKKWVGLHVGALYHMMLVGTIRSDRARAIATD